MLMSITWLLKSIIFSHFPSLHYVDFVELSTLAGNSVTSLHKPSASSLVGRLIITVNKLIYIRLGVANTIG